MKRATLVFALLLTALLATLAMPVQVWRTGRMEVPPLTLANAGAHVRPIERLWIDTDAACGHTQRTDVDDCLALWLVARSAVEVAGVSTVFGNAPLDATHRTTSELAGLVAWSQPRIPVVSPGAAEPMRSSAASATPAHEALVHALEAGPLTILALGPLTNIAQALRSRPDLRKNVSGLIAVMGRRAGHLFHPSEGSGRGFLLGHGPVFRDFNFAADPEAVRAVIPMRLPLTLIPYDAAISVEVTAEDLDRLASQDKAGSWIADRSRGWLEYWRTDVGRAGFYPFDAMAAAYVIEPSLFRCAGVQAWTGTDPLMFVPLLRPEALLVAQEEAEHGSPARYCPAAEPQFDARMAGWFTDPGGLSVD